MSQLAGATSNSAPATAAPPTQPLSSSINIAQQYFSQRPEPLPIVDSNKRKKCRTSEDVRLMHRVGGYDHADYQNRNWFEIRNQLQNLQNS